MTISATTLAMKFSRKSRSDCAKPPATAIRVARLGGDEFALLMASDDDRAGAEALAGRIIDAICQPIFVGGRECRVGVSIGIAILPPPPTADKAALMKAADEAMYEAKKAGGSQYHIRGHLTEEHQFEEH